MQLLFIRLGPNKISNPVPIIKTTIALAKVCICSSEQLTAEKASSWEQSHKAEAAAFVPPALPLQFYGVMSLNFER